MSDPLRTYTYKELTQIRRDLQKENAELKTQLLYRKANVEGEKLAREAMQEELDNQVKYAELGRLAMELSICNELFNYGSTNCLNFICCEYERKFCQKRAELLAGDDNEDDQCQLCHNALQCLVWSQDGIKKAKCDQWNYFKQHYASGNKKIIGAELLAEEQK